MTVYYELSIPDNKDRHFLPSYSTGNIPGLFSMQYTINNLQQESLKIPPKHSILLQKYCSTNLREKAGTEAKE